MTGTRVEDTLAQNIGPDGPPPCGMSTCGVMSAYVSQPHIRLQKMLELEVKGSYFLLKSILLLCVSSRKQSKKSRTVKQIQIVMDHDDRDQDGNNEYKWDRDEYGIEKSGDDNELGLNLSPFNGEVQSKITLLR